MAKHIWTITKLGKRIASDISSKKDLELEILRFLHSNGASSTEDIALSIGVSESRALSKLRSMKGKVQELTGGLDG